SPLLQSDFFNEGNNTAGFSRHDLRPSAVSVRRGPASDVLSHKPASIETGMGFHHRPRSLESGNDRWSFLHAVLVAQEYEIGGINRRRRHLDQDLPGLRRWGGNIFYV